MKGAAYVIARSVACLCALEAMKALNTERIRNDLALAYAEESFDNLISEFGLDHNQVVTVLNEMG